MKLVTWRLLVSLLRQSPNTLLALSLRANFLGTLESLLVSTVVECRSTGLGST